MFQLVSRILKAATPLIVAIVLTTQGHAAHAQFLDGFPTASPISVEQSTAADSSVAVPSGDDTGIPFPSLDDVSNEQTINAETLTFGSAPAASPTTATPSVTSAPAAAPATAAVAPQIALAPTATIPANSADAALSAAAPDAAAAAPQTALAPTASTPASSANAAASAAPTAASAATAVAPQTVFAPSPSPAQAPSTAAAAAAPVVSPAQAAISSPVPGASSAAVDASATVPAQGTDFSTAATGSVAAVPAIGLTGPASGKAGNIIVGNDLSAFPLCKSTSRRLDTSHRDLTPVESQRGLRGRRLPSFLTGVDPLELIQQFVVTILIVICLFFLWKHRTQVTILLTGDDTIHTSFLDCVWVGCFRCCGLCTHDWSRCLTSLPCCPTSFHGTNLVKSLGSRLGVTTRTIEISNLVVGDLPFYRRAAFYMSVECSANPPMRTAVQEDKHPKTVHFPEVVTLRIRDSMLDTMVTITVYQLHVVGSNQLCQIKLSPRNIMDWALDSDPNRRIKRFAMKVSDPEAEVETPPWISLEFGLPTADVRHLDGFHGNASYTIRTATRGLDESTGLPYRDMPIGDFKAEYHLVDNTGSSINEPDESDLWRLTRCRNIIVCVYSFLSSVLILAVIAWGAFRYYVKNCYDKFRVLTIAENWTPHEFPMPACALKSIDQKCADLMSGTGIDEGENICRPTDEAVEETCVKPPQAQARPRAFEYLAEDIGQPWLTAPCFHGICKFRNEVIKYDHFVVGGAAVLLFLVLCCFRPLANTCLRNEKARLKAESSAAQASRRQS